MKHNKKILLQCVVALIVITLNQYAPDFIESTRYILLGLVILLIGMPHGALDHIIDGNLEGWDPYSFNRRFYSWYLSAIVLYSVLWIFFPLFSFGFFLLITLYHFGQADAERFDLDGWANKVIHFSRGISVVGLIVYGDLVYASEVIESVTDFSYENFSNQLFPSEFGAYTLALVYPVAFTLTALIKKIPAVGFFVYFLDAIIVSALFLFCDPVWAFSIYFGLWHSYNHVKVMLSYLADQDKEVSMGWFYKNSFIFSLLSYLGLLFIYNMLDAFGNEELMVSLLFIVISVLTLPHMIVVEKLYSKFKP